MSLALRALALAAAGAALGTSAADIVLTPPTGGGVSVTNAAGNIPRFRVGEDGIITWPGVIAVPQPATALCVETSTLRVGTCSAAGGGMVTQVTATAPLSSTGGGTPEISLTGIVPVAKGGTGTNGFGYGVLIGNGGGAITTSVGNPGQMLVGTPGLPAWSYSPEILGSYVLPATSAADAGNIMKGSERFIHNSGTRNTFVGVVSGNFFTTGADNSGFGAEALRMNGSGTANVAIGSQALASNNSGNNNVAIGYYTLLAQTTASNNIAVGHRAGTNIIGGSFNISIGSEGTFSDANTVRIGTAGNHNRAFIAGVRGVTTGQADALPVVIDGNGQLGTVSRQQGEHNAGPGVAGVNVFTITFPTPFVGAVPKVMVTSRSELFGGFEVNDTIMVTVRAVSLTQFKVNAYRVDIAGGLWSTDLKLVWTAWQ